MLRFSRPGRDWQYNLRVPKENKMAGRIRQSMWASNRRQPGEGNLGSLLFILFIILPLVIITHGQILVLLAGFYLIPLLSALFSL
jgi:hypothetical protein